MSTQKQVRLSGSRAKRVILWASVPLGRRVRFGAVVRGIGREVAGAVGDVAQSGCACLRALGGGL